MEWRRLSKIDRSTSEGGRTRRHNTTRLVLALVVCEAPRIYEFTFFKKLTSQLICPSNRSIFVEAFSRSFFGLHLHPHLHHDSMMIIVQTCFQSMQIPSMACRREILGGGSVLDRMIPQSPGIAPRDCEDQAYLPRRQCLHQESSSTAMPIT